MGASSPPIFAPDESIPETNVVFDDEGGHTHEGANGTGTPIPLAGDVTGTSAATLVEQIQAVPIPAPTSAEDGMAVVYNDSSGEFEYQALAGSGSRTPQVVDSWYDNAVAASQTAVVLTRDASAAPQGFYPVVDGDLLGVLAVLDDPRTAGTLTVEVYVNGVATGLSAVIDGTNPTLKITTQGIGADTFSAGDLLTLRVTTDAGFLPITANLRASLLVGYAPVLP